MSTADVKMTAHEKIKVLADENVILRHQYKKMEQDALTMLSAYDQMRGQYNAMFECAEHLKQAAPDVWSAYFSKAAKRKRLRDGLDVRCNK